MLAVRLTQNLVEQLMNTAVPIADCGDFGSYYQCDEKPLIDVGKSRIRAIGTDRTYEPDVLQVQFLPEGKKTEHPIESHELPTSELAFSINPDGTISPTFRSPAFIGTVTNLKISDPTVEKYLKINLKTEERVIKTDNGDLNAAVTFLGFSPKKWLTDGDRQALQKDFIVSGERGSEKFSIKINLY